MNEPSATAIWKKLNEITDKLHQLSEQLARSDERNDAYHRALDIHRGKIEELERENNTAKGAISMLRWWLVAVLSVALAGGTWTIGSINQLKQDMAVIQSRENRK